MYINVTVVINSHDLSRKDLNVEKQPHVAQSPCHTAAGNKLH